MAANLAAGENGSGAYNVSTNRETSMNDLLKLIASEVGESAVLTFNPKNVGVLRSALDNSKAAAELQWQPKTSLEDGIKQTVSWYKTFLSKE